MFEKIEQVNDFFSSRQAFGIKPGLDRIYHMLACLQHPQENVKSIHVAGTNGKGSTIRFMKEALINNGYQVGVFTSPSMTGVTGHMFINHQEINEETFLDIFNDVFPVIKEMDEQNMHPTEFEIITAIAFVFFENHADIVLLETGMGGREDTTNCVNPLLSVIVNVDMDHTAYLGGTLENIAWHKAGIIKNNIPVILGEMQSNVMGVIEREAHLKQAPVYRLKEDFTYDKIEYTEEGLSYIWHGKNNSYLISLRMLGLHQVQNSSLAMKALMLLQEQGYRLTTERTMAAFHHTQLEGRFELIKNDPIIVLDGAHNPAGIHSFLQTVLSTYPEQEKHLVFAGFKDKNLAHMIKKCVPHFDSITLTTFDHPRTADSETLAHFAAGPNIQVISRWENHLEQVLKSNSNAVNFITGSLHFVSEVRRYLLRKNKLD